MKEKNSNDRIRWEELLPEEFFNRQQQKSLVYLPMGICEPHGHIAPLGLDTLKANFLCEESARRFGGIVAPTLGYQIHESGFHAQWLEEVVGPVNPVMTAMPPEVMLRFFLYQLRAFANAGFKSILAITGHAGGNEDDYTWVANCFMEETNVQVIVKADPALVAGKFKGDHAGKYEISQLLYLRPELMAMDRMDRIKTNYLGQFAQGEDASEASAKLGKEIIEASIMEIGRLVAEIPVSKKEHINLDYPKTEVIWQIVLDKRTQWTTIKPRPNQPPVPKGSRWLPYENC